MLTQKRNIDRPPMQNRSVRNGAIAAVAVLLVGIITLVAALTVGGYWPSNDFSQLSATLLTAAVSMYLCSRICASILRINVLESFFTRIHGAIGWAAVIALGLFAWAYLGRPEGRLGASGFQEVMREAIGASLDGMYPGQPIFVAVGPGHDIRSDLANELALKWPSYIFLPWSQREDAVAGVDDRTMPTGVSKENRLALTNLSFPLWRTAVVHVQTASCRTTIVLLEGPEGWRAAFRRLDECA